MSWVAVAVAAVSAVSSISAGQQQARALKTQARQADLNAQAEKLAGRREALEIENKLAQDLASQNALFAARGTLQGEGSSLAAQETAQENASKDIDLALFNSEIASLNAKQRAANARSDASAAKTQGYLNAAQAGLSGYGTYQTKTSVPTGNKKPTLLSGLK